MTEAFEGCDAILREACGSWFTGAVARIERRGRTVFERAYGTTRLDERGRPVYVDTRFDLASLTKLFVASIVLELCSNGALSLDASLAHWFPSWRGNDRQAITVRMLLAHTSGMQSGADYRAIRELDVEAFALARELAGVPGQRVIYSDLGFITLGVLIRRVTGASLSSRLRRTFPSAGLGFSPAARARSQIPATEDDGWRGRVQGYVHDEKAYLMGGAAGHAGLFGTAADVAHLSQWYLGATCGRKRGPLSPQLAREAVREAAYDPVLRRGLGWALKTNDQNSCGRWFAPSSFGHTGFVGTCVWAGPERDLLGVLLTNSVYFGRSDSRPLRAAFYDMLVEESGLS